MGNVKSLPPTSFYGKAVAIINRLKTTEGLDAMIVMLNKELDGSQAVCLAPRQEILFLVALAVDRRATMLVPPDYVD